MSIDFAWVLLLGLLAGTVGGVIGFGTSIMLICEARAGVRPPLVLELYTSEGCSSCPLADRWLSSLKAGAEVLPLAFHVSYWNRLGWADRFASTEATQRQYEWARAMAASNVYTPQVVAGGRDWRRWPTLPEAPTAAPMALALRRDGARVTADVGAAPGRWMAYWAVLEDGHRSRVTAGENNGETLAHDHVVRQYKPVSAWSGSSQRFELQLPAAEGGRPQRVVFVVEDAATRRPGCVPEQTRRADVCALAEPPVSSRWRPAADGRDRPKRSSSWPP